MRIKRGADLGCFLVRIKLKSFRKHVTVLDKTEFAAMFQIRTAVSKDDTN